VPNDARLLNAQLVQHANHLLNDLICRQDLPQTHGHTRALHHDDRMP
jgi:hypothetical protein